MAEERKGTGLFENAPAPLYSNNVSIQSLPWDVTMVFGQILGIHEDAEGKRVAAARPQATIVMSPQHAKAFLIALGDNIRKYEQHYGPIALPSNEDDAAPSSPDRNDAAK